MSSKRYRNQGSRASEGNGDEQETTVPAVNSADGGGGEVAGAATEAIVETAGEETTRQETGQANRLTRHKSPREVFYALVGIQKNGGGVDVLSTAVTRKQLYKATAALTNTMRRFYASVDVWKCRRVD